MGGSQQRSLLKTEVTGILRYRGLNMTSSKVPSVLSGGTCQQTLHTATILGEFSMSDSNIWHRVLGELHL